MRMLVCLTCGVSDSLDDDEFGADNRHDGHSTVMVAAATDDDARVKAAHLGVHQHTPAVLRDKELS